MTTYNYCGEILSDVKLQLLSSDYGYVDDDNIPHINWGVETEKCDNNGFDKEYRPIDQSEEYVISDYVIPKGTMICRYGYPGGFFTTIRGTDYDSLGLPYVKETIEYHEYLVSEDLAVSCYVTKGLVAPKFQSNGGAIQFMHRQTIFLECEDGFLQEDTTWRQKNI